MTRISWGEDKSLENGLDRGVLYLPSGAVPWVGLTGMDENSEGGEVASYYFDGVKVLDVIPNSDSGFVLTAYTYPEEFEQCEGVDGEATGQPHVPFGLSYRTFRGTYAQIHLVYNATAVHSGKSRKTTTEVVSPSDFSWTITTVPVDVPLAMPTAHLIIDTEKIRPEVLAQIEEWLYGDTIHTPYFPTPQELVDAMNYHATLMVVNHGDGSWTASGPDDVVRVLDDDSFEIVSPSVVYTDPDTYTVSDY